MTITEQKAKLWAQVCDPTHLSSLHNLFVESLRIDVRIYLLILHETIVKTSARECHLLPMPVSGYKSKTAGFRRVVSENLGIRGSKVRPGASCVLVMKVILDDTCQTRLCNKHATFGLQNLAAWAVAGTVAYVLWVQPGRKAEQDKRVHLMQRHWSHTSQLKRIHCFVHHMHHMTGLLRAIEEVIQRTMLCRY